MLTEQSETAGISSSLEKCGLCFVNCLLTTRGIQLPDGICFIVDGTGHSYFAIFDSVPGVTYTGLSVLCHPYRLS